MKRLITLILICFALCACSSSSSSSSSSSVAQESEDIDRLQRNLSYYKDTRNNLCYAGMNIKYRDSAILTNVPCTPEVESLVLNFNSKAKERK